MSPAREGEVLAVQGDSCDAAYVLASGRVLIYGGTEQATEDKNGSLYCVVPSLEKVLRGEVPHRALPAGGCFGGEALTRVQPHEVRVWPYHVAAKEDTTLVVLTAQAVYLPISPHISTDISPRVTLLNGNHYIHSPSL